MILCDTSVEERGSVSEVWTDDIEDFRAEFESADNHELATLKVGNENSGLILHLTKEQITVLNKVFNDFVDTQNTE